MISTVKSVICVAYMGGVLVGSVRGVEECAVNMRSGVLYAYYFQHRENIKVSSWLLVAATA